MDTARIMHTRIMDTARNKTKMTVDTARLMITRIMTTARNKTKRTRPERTKDKNENENNKLQQQRRRPTSRHARFDTCPDADVCLSSVIYTYVEPAALYLK